MVKIESRENFIRKNARARLFFFHACAQCRAGGHAVRARVPGSIVEGGRVKDEDFWVEFVAPALPRFGCRLEKEERTRPI